MWTRTTGARSGNSLSGRTRPQWLALASPTDVGPSFSAPTAVGWLLRLGSAGYTAGTSGRAYLVRSPGSRETRMTRNFHLELFVLCCSPPSEGESSLGTRLVIGVKLAGGL